MAAESTGNPPPSVNPTTADSYIGSLISLTSKSDIRYEGLLYNINTQESSIGLKNVRSFGTEGRKKDGPQIPPSDKVYEYILFRGTDIKDLQVKSFSPVQPTPPINDPAIIQSHYPRPVSTSTILPSTGSSGSLTDLGSHDAQMGPTGINFHGGLPLYQPGGNLGTWGASPPPPNANGSGIAMPMYWQGYYGPPSGLPHLHQQSLLHPPHGLSMPPSMQQPMQYPGFNTSIPTGATNLLTSNLPGSVPTSSLSASLPDVASPLLPISTSSPSLPFTSSASSVLPSTLPVIPSATLSSDTIPSLMPNKVPKATLPPTNLNASLPLLSTLATSSPELNTIALQISNKPTPVFGQTTPYQSSAQPISSVVGASSSLRTEIPAPSLVTPGQLLQSGPTTVPSSRPEQIAHKDVEVVQVSSSSPESSMPVATEALPPILPLPVPSRANYKPHGASLHARYGPHGYRGRGRGTGTSRPITKFAEDFDFMAMNEKFNKDEVWGHLGKGNKSHSKDKEDGKVSDEDDFQDEVDEVAKIEVKPVYNKDDFFDTLSSNVLDNESQYGRIKFSEQMKIDTETFGDFSRYRGGRGGRGGPRGGRSWGSYRGRGYGSDYIGRGRGRGRGRGMASRGF